MADAAFGAHPGAGRCRRRRHRRAAWLRAVAAGGQGRYGVALTDLDAIDARRRAARRVAGPQHQGVVPSAARRHVDARGWDGRALARRRAATPTRAPTRWSGWPPTRWEWAGSPLSARLLRARRGPRRRGRVGATARAVRVGERRAGDVHGATVRPRSATPSAPVASAAQLGSVRHAVKSRRRAGGRAVQRGHRRALDGRSPTLRWRPRSDSGWCRCVGPLACLLVDIGSASRSRRRRSPHFATSCADVVRRRGGVWSSRGEPCKTASDH